MWRNKSPSAPPTTQHDTQQQTDIQYSVKDEYTHATVETHAIAKICQKVLRDIQDLEKKNFEKA